MNMKVKNTFLVLTLVFSISVHAQTVKWCIHPEYAKVDYVCEDLFKCVDFSGKWHFIDLNGNVLIPNVNADAITDFEEGYAIVLKGNKIVGFIAEAQGHGFQPVAGDYSITQYDFFSEGLLVVADSKGKMGYMDVHGNLAIPSKYEQARPFKQGYASVEVGKKNVYYINPQGKTRNPEGFHGGNLTKGSSFNGSGEAVVANYQDYAIIGTNMQVRRKIAYTPDFPVRYCDYAYSEGEGNGCVEPSNFNGEEDNRIERYSENGAFGYQWKNGNEGDKLPAQFSEALPFYDGRAIVQKTGNMVCFHLLRESSPQAGRMSCVSILTANAATCNLPLKRLLRLNAIRSTLNLTRAMEVTKRTFLWSMVFCPTSAMVQRNAL